jgi:hypothetical protein
MEVFLFIWLEKEGPGAYISLILLTKIDVIGRRSTFIPSFDEKADLSTSAMASDPAHVATRTEQFANTSRVMKMRLLVWRSRTSSEATSI